MSNPQLLVAPEVAQTGIKVRMAICEVPEVKNRRNGSLEKHITEVIARLKIGEFLASPVLKEYKRFYDELGIADALSPAEHLLRIIERTGGIPNINNAVDCYNIVSAETLLSIGAHNLDAIKGNVQFKRTTGDEKYIPLGKSEPEKVLPGEYACMDDEKIICRMDIKQCEETKIAKGVTKFIVYAQGNKETTEEYVASGLKNVCENIANFCGGKCEIVEN